MREYLEHFTTRLGLSTAIQFNSRVTALRWDEEEQFWDVTVEDHPRVRARKVVLATGLLEQPVYPKITGPNFTVPGGNVTTVAVLMFLALLLNLMALSPDYRVAVFIGPLWLGVLLLSYSLLSKNRTRNRVVFEANPVRD